MKASQRRLAAANSDQALHDFESDSTQRLGESCMTCVELQESLAENESGSNAAQRAHLRDCPQCSALVAELLVIVCAAGELRAANEPSPRVWNSIEIALKQ